MTVQILVKNRLSQPVEGARVRVVWKGGGTSNERTGSNGIADLRCSAGTITHLYIDDVEMGMGELALKDGVTSFNHRTK